ncbi:MAG: GyrI-like domain-containing protein [Syntrophobacteraceae bacterium]
MSKIDFKKDFKAWYKAPENGFVFVELPPVQYLMIDGAGDPNSVPEFQSAVETLYGVAYTIKFSAKKAGVGPEYSIPPLDGLWWCEGMQGCFDPENRSLWRWSLMLIQPHHVNGAMVLAAAEQLTAKGKQGPFGGLRLQSLEEGLCVQTLHVGPYCDEAPRITAMHRYVEDVGYLLHGKHHEIYLSDPRRTSPEKLKTILRNPVVKQ